MPEAAGKLPIPTQVNPFVQIGIIVLVAVASAFVLSHIAPKPRGISTADRGYTSNIRATQKEKAIIYGKTRVGGVIVYEEATDQNRFFHRIVAIAGHEIDGFEEFYADGLALGLGENEVAIHARNGKMFVQGYTGADTQTAVPELTSKSSLWTEAHRLRGIAYIYMRLEHDSNEFPSGPPVITALVRGKKVFVPPNNRTEWTDNPAWCIRDYLLSHPEMGVQESHLDEQSFASAATACTDEDYTFNGFFTSDVVPREVLGHMRTSMAGWYWYARGRHSIKAGTYTAPVASFDEGDLRSALRVTTEVPTREKSTTVRGTFQGRESNYQEAAYPEVRDEIAIRNDGREAVLNLPLPFTDNPTTCQKIARIMLNRSRQQIALSASFSLKAATVKVADNVRITNTRLGWVNKVFEVNEWDLGFHANDGLIVNMTMTESSENIYDWDDSLALDFIRDNTVLPDPSFVEAPTMTVSHRVDTGHEQLQTTLFVDVDFPANFIGRVDTAEVQFSGSDGVWVNMGQAGGGRYFATGIQDGTYNVRARIKSIYGVFSEYVTRHGYEVKALPDAPPDVTGFLGTTQGGVINLSWDSLEDPGLSHYQIRFSSDLNGTIDYSQILERKVARPATSVTVPARRGIYFIRAVDKAGSKSINAAQFIVQEDPQDDALIVETYDGANDSWSYA